MLSHRRVRSSRRTEELKGENLSPSPSATPPSTSEVTIVGTLSVCQKSWELVFFHPPSTFTSPPGVFHLPSSADSADFVFDVFASCVDKKVVWFTNNVGVCFCLLHSGQNIISTEGTPEIWDVYQPSFSNKCTFAGRFPAPCHINAANFPSNRHN